ncbi:MAG TPA: hypothetical protein VGC49_04780 [Solirubrobacterales bacterium]
MARNRSNRAALTSLLIAALALVLMASPKQANADRSVRVLGPEAVRSTIEAFVGPTPPRPVRVRVLPCPGDPTAQGCHSSSPKIDTIWLNPQAGGLDSETLAHEMGHVFESYMWDLRWRHVPGSDFVPTTFEQIAAILFEDPPPGILYSTAWSERFAESYSACARFEQLTETLATHYWGFEMTPAQHELICPLIDSMASDYEQATAPGPLRTQRHRRRPALAPVA